MGSGDETTENTRPVFDSSIEWTPLGAVASRTYPSCTNRYCSEATRSRTVEQSYDAGYLSAVGDFAPSIRYHPSGMVANIRHGNGVVWRQTADPWGMARPAQIYTSGASENLNTGAFAYDGAGNVVRTGADRYLYDEVSRIEKADLGRFPESCSDFLWLDYDTEDATVVHESCGTIRVGNEYTITYQGDVTLRAEGPVVFHDGFALESGGKLAVESGAAVNLSPESPVERAQDYDYDRFGNLTHMVTDGATRTIMVDEATNRMSAGLFQYDRFGNMISQPVAQDPTPSTWHRSRGQFIDPETVIPVPSQCP